MQLRAAKKFHVVSTHVDAAHLAGHHVDRMRQYTGLVALDIDIEQVHPIERRQDIGERQDTNDGDVVVGIVALSLQVLQGQSQSQSQIVPK